MSLSLSLFDSNAFKFYKLPHDHNFVVCQYKTGDIIESIGNHLCFIPHLWIIIIFKSHGILNKHRVIRNISFFNKKSATLALPN